MLHWYYVYVCTLCYQFINKLKELKLFLRNRELFYNFYSTYYIGAFIVLVTSRYRNLFKRLLQIVYIRSAIYWYRKYLNHFSKMCVLLTNGKTICKVECLEAAIAIDRRLLIREYLIIMFYRSYRLKKIEVKRLNSIKRLKFYDPS